MVATGLEPILLAPAFGALLGMLFNKLTSKEFQELFKKWKFDVSLLSNLKFALLTVTAVLNDAEEKQITSPSIKDWLNEVRDAVYAAEDVLDEIANRKELSGKKTETKATKNDGRKEDKPSFTKATESKVKQVINRLESIAQQKDVLGLKEGVGKKLSVALPSTSLVDESEIFGRENDKQVILGFLLPNHQNIVVPVDGREVPEGNMMIGPIHSDKNEPAVKEEEDTADQNEAQQPVMDDKDPSNEAISSTEVVVLAAAVEGDETQPEEKNFAENGHEIPMVAIVGMPGVGKTTLAQLLFNDMSVKETFLPRIWVHVSDEFDILKITRTIYHCLTNNHSHAADLNTLQVRLQKILENKRFLLVLDDIWNENFIDWDVLLKPFKAASYQSRIIVTTRSRNVAIIMHSALVYQLSCLSQQDCWNLFEKHAFAPGKLYISPAMKKIGEKILNKCNGLPLAAKTLGVLLHAKQDIAEWETVLNSEIWDLPYGKSNILPALRLSYHHLPTHLKRCFAYCSIFPKGFRFKKEQLILLWMAEGLLLSRRENFLLDEGEKYFEELLSRSFFQQVPQGGKQYFVMHDLFNDLARSLTREFLFKAEDGVLHNVPKRARYFSFTIGKFDISTKLFHAFQGANHLRTFLPIKLNSDQEARYSSPLNLAEMLQAFSRLRVLSLQDHKISDLHESIGNLKYLRYLDLSGTEIRELKEDICSLFNLETLLLSKCDRLIKLPENMHKLINLQHLDISETQVTKMPTDFGSLKNLRILNAFVVGKNGSKISELKELFNLRTLSIIRLETASVADVLHAKLNEKKYLNELVLHWLKVPHDANNASKVLELLKPHKNLKKLAIENYCGKTFPNWLSNGSMMSGLMSLHLTEFANCSSLPPLGQLPSLKELHIVKMSSLTMVDSNFCRTTSPSIDPFKILEILKFEDMPELSSITIVEQFPCLKELHLVNCPKLNGNLPKDLPSLKTLRISKCAALQLEFLQDKYMALERLKLESSNNLEYFQLAYFPKLQSLQIHDCKKLKSLQIFKPHEFLGEFSILSCPQLQLISLFTPNLKLLSVSDCPLLESLPEQMRRFSSLQELKISDCPNLRSFEEGDLPSNLKLLSIENCTNFTPKAEWNLHEMDSLRSFKIEGGCEGMKTFPGDELLPSTLTCLEIVELQDLQSLNYLGLRNLTFLETLKIHSCDNLNSISKERLPLSLSHLEIVGCGDSLIQSCKEGGEDWDKICHIHKIIIDDDELYYN